MPHTERPRRFRAAMLAAVTVVGSLALGALCAEATARWVLDDGMHFDVEMWKYARDLKRVSAYPGVGHEHRPGTSSFLMGVPVSINSLGLRDREVTVEKPQGVVRTLMLGDSLTFGWGVEARDTPAKLLEARLNAREAGRHEVINTGVGNLNTQMEVAYFLARGKDLNPDTVVLNYFINDAEPTPKRTQSYMLDHSQAVVEFLAAYDRLSRLFSLRPDWQAYYRGLYGKDQAGWQGAQDAFARLADYCGKHGIRLLIASYPELHEVAPYPFAEVDERLRAMAAEKGVEFLPLAPSVADLKPETLWVSPGDAHPNRIANERFAASLEAALHKVWPALYEPENIQTSDAVN